MRNSILLISGNRPLAAVYSSNDGCNNEESGRVLPDELGRASRVFGIFLQRSFAEMTAWTSAVPGSLDDSTFVSLALRHNGAARGGSHYCFPLSPCVTF